MLQILRKLQKERPLIQWTKISFTDQNTGSSIGFLMMCGDISNTISRGVFWNILSATAAPRQATYGLCLCPIAPPEICLCVWFFNTKKLFSWNIFITFNTDSVETIPLLIAHQHIALWRAICWWAICWYTKQAYCPPQKRFKQNVWQF